MNTFSLPAVITHQEAQVVLTRFQASLKDLNAAEEKIFQIDARDLTVFNSSALAVLLGFKRELQMKGMHMKVLHLSESLQNLAKVYGVDHFLASP
jgi:phospholipid transport system transporter-binding protein